MIKRLFPILGLVVVLMVSTVTGCGNGNEKQGVQEDSISALSDEFDNAATLSEWRKALDTKNEEEFLAKIDINETSAGQLFVEPNKGTWYGTNTGHLSYKEITGNFVTTMRVKVTGKNSPVPTGEFDISGLMVRVPSQAESAAVAPSKENWEYLSTGGQHGVRLIDYKTNVNGNFSYQTKPVNTEWMELRVARIENTVIKLYKEDGGQWQFISARLRSDFPDKLQVGLCLLTNIAGEADNLTFVDYIRFQTPATDDKLLGKIADQTIEEAEWLSLLGKD
jgi:regulation of enolase protein 1 (concanavalin A-like superfamily)